MKGKSIARIKINGFRYSLRATEHSLERMEQRGISGYVIAGDVISLGKERILELQKKQVDVALIDKKRGIAVIMQFKNNTLKILTVIDKANIYVKDGTEIEELYCGG